MNIQDGLSDDTKSLSPEPAWSFIMGNCLTPLDLHRSEGDSVCITLPTASELARRKWEESFTYNCRACISANIDMVDCCYCMGTGLRIELYAPPAPEVLYLCGIGALITT